MTRRRRTVALFGSSTRGRQCRQLLRDHRDIEAVCFFDNDPGKWGTVIAELPVLEPSAEAVAAVDSILIASMYVHEIHEQLARLGVAGKIALSVPELESGVAGGGGAASGASGGNGWALSDEAAAVLAARERGTAPPAAGGEGLLGCTVCSNNYVAYATTVARSFLEHHPAARFAVGLVDRRQPGLPYPDADDPRIEIVEAESLEIPDFERCAFKYGAVELNCLVKPFLLERLLATHPGSKLVYLDPDILVLDSLQPLAALLDEHAIALVPHITTPYRDDRSPTELDMLRLGTFNLGFIALSGLEKAGEFLTWWQGRVHRHGAVDTARGVFVDQKWIDLVPSLFPDHVVVRDPGYDVAYWNLHERTVMLDGSRFLVNGRPLRFFHFSGFDPRSIDAVSKFQNRVTLPDRGALRALFEIYRHLVTGAGHLEIGRAPYAFGRFDNGASIGRAVRRAFAAAPESAYEGSPFGSGERSFFAWLNSAIRPGSRVTRLMSSIRDASPELRARFAGTDAESEAQLVEYVGRAARLHDIDPVFLGGEPPARRPAATEVRDTPARRPAATELPDRPARRLAATELPLTPAQRPAATELDAGPTHGVNIVGYFDADTGVGELARGLARAFRHAGVPVAEVVLLPDGSFRDASSGGVRNPHSVNLVVVNADQVGRFTEVAGRDFFADRFNVGYWAWELSEFPACYRPAFAPFQEIWTLSGFVRDALAQCAPIPVVVIPPALEEADYEPGERGGDGSDIVFLTMFDYRSYADRKNPLGVIEAFRRAFGAPVANGRRARLVVKAGGVGAAPAAHAAVVAAAAEVSAEVLTAAMSRAEVRSLVARADCYVSLHRAEGFGLPLAEAMAAGKPVVATDYSGNRDFQSASNALLVPAREIRLASATGPYPAGAAWAEPDIDRAAAWMRWVAENPAAASQIGARAAEDARRMLSPAAVAAQALARLREATGDARWAARDRDGLAPGQAPAKSAAICEPSEPEARLVTSSSAGARGRVQVVLADNGWILERCARELESRLPKVTVGMTADATAALNYYVNYSAYRGRTGGRQAAFFTHVEERAESAARRFFDVAREMDASVAMSALYARQLREAGVGRVEVIVPGVDLDEFRPGVRIGVVGRTYHTGRKGEALVAAVMDMPGIEWHFTGEGWPGPAETVPPERMGAFYRSMDYILVPAYYEGGPMPLLEALACGVEVIAPAVGFVPDYPHIEFETGSVESLRGVLTRLVGERLARRASVEHRTWEAWAAGHERLFASLAGPAASLVRVPVEPPGASVAVPAPAERPRVAAAQKRLRVLLALHAPESRSMTGGPATRVPAMRAALRAIGVDAEITTEERPSTAGFDVAHVFNVWEPASALRQLQHFRSAGLPVVFSPIYMPLAEALWAQFVIPPAVTAASGADIDACLRQVLAVPREQRVPPEGRGLSVLRTFPDQVREMLASSDMLLGLSRFELASLSALWPDRPPAALVLNGTDPDAFEGVSPRPFAERYGVSDYVLCVGRIEPRKNQLMLVRALAGTGWPVVLVGHEADPAYADIVRRHGGDNLLMTGRLDRRDPLLASAIAGARAFALPSWIEGAPLSALEAAAAGVPLALGDRSGEREYFGGLASYADPGDMESIRRAVAAARAQGDDPSHREKLRALVRASLTWRHAAEATAHAYGEAIEAWRNRGVRGSGPTIDGDGGACRKLEVGSGESPTPGYEHLDSRPDLPHLEHVCDFRGPLPFPDGHYDELLARSCLEHVSWREAPGVLAEWARVLKPGGTLDVWVPDLAYICRAYLDDQPDDGLDPGLRRDARELLGSDDRSAWALLKLFGGQEYRENFHGAAFDFAVLSRLLERTGYTAIERREPYYGLHVVARRANQEARSEDGSQGEGVASEPRRLPLPVHVRWGAGIFNYSGYAALCRHLVRGLDEVGVPVEVQAFDRDEARRSRFIATLPDRERWERLTRQKVEQGVYVCCHTPAPWDGGDAFLGVRQANRGFHSYVGITMFETDRLPAGWANACESMDEIWVPSEFNRETFVRAGVNSSIVHVMPVGIDADGYDPERVTPLEVPGRHGFTFLSVFQWTRRKGWDVLLDAFARAFTRDDDVCLVIRSSLPGGSSAPSPAQQVRDHFDRLGIPARRAPRVVVLDRPVADRDMPRLYRAADAFVLPTRGEGWGLPFMEAMASGLPTIGTRWSAQLDFMNDANSYLIPIEGLVPVDRQQTIDNPFYAADHRWAQPSVEATAELMRRVFERRDEARDVGRRARADIRAAWTPERTARWIRDRVEASVRANPRRYDRVERLERGREAEAQGRVDEALSFYREAAGPNGRWLIADYNLASLCRRANRHEEAKASFERVAGRAGTAALRAGARFHLGCLAFDRGDLRGSLEAFDSCLAEVPDHRRAREWRWLVAGRMAEAAGDVSRVLECYGQAHEANPAWDLAAYNLASAERRAGRASRALELFAGVMRASPSAATRAGAHFHTAELLDEAGDRERAIGHLESCLIENPGHRRASELLLAWAGAGVATAAAVPHRGGTDG